MPIRRVFINWRRPALEQTAEWLCNQYATSAGIDLQSAIVALPGGRAGRRLLELLVARAEQLGKPLVPPKIVTVGKLPEELYVLKKPTAGSLAQQLAWVQALRSLTAKQLEPLVPHLPADDDLEAWLALARMLVRLHTELASARLDFAQVEKHGRRLPDFDESGRWQTLAKVQERYLRVLDDLELWDLQTARLYAIEHGEGRTDSDVYVVGAVDLDQAQRAMLEAVADRVTAVIFAPEADADRFDAHGCLLPAAWVGQPIPLAAGQVVVAQQPADQADAVVTALAAWQGRYAAEDITIGVADPSLVPDIQQRLEEYELKARYGAGEALTRTGPYRLLEAVAVYLERRSFETLAALVRHPAVDAWLVGKMPECDWLSLLDAYATRHLPAELNGKWLGSSHRREPLQKLEKAINELTRPLTGKARPLTEWSQPILELLATIYASRPLDREVEADRVLIAACSEIRETLDEQQQIDARLSGKVSAGQAVDLLLGQLASKTIPPPTDASAIELLGWLELPLDDAPALLVTGFNEGLVPSAHTSDLFLPNELRRTLGLEDNDRRYARDVYALSMLLASRPELKLVAGRRTADGDPLLPSRLLLACEGAELARRTKAFFSPQHARHSPQVPKRLKPGPRRAFDVPHPRPLAEPVTKMRVTEFRDYLACPYRYYLRHCLGLESLSDRVVELQANQFGSLVHDVLRDFGRGGAADASDEQAIADWLDGALAAAVEQSFGTRPLAAVAVQVEQLRLRLHAFARWQAAWRAEGWKIAHVECAFDDKPVPFLVDGEPMLLTGRIDRIDVHEPSGRWMVFDYKTADSPKTPDEAHRREGGWLDLQLPLYRQLVGALSAPADLGLGYIVLPKAVAKAGLCEAPWTAEELVTAEAAAAQVIRAIRDEVFWPPVSPPPAFCEDFAAICQDGQFAAAAGALEPEESWS
ncbi:MAG TPA: PD-(D/E)XK nuclease family protein [Pirellulales bacterium]|jgi:inactivated superfamily I helicase/RecB family exonuclease|nr:PD-(D/E)XK nuclease family protein [Pirellulales bacterium]